MSAKQIEIGIRWHPDHGHRFFGIDEVNECLKQGATITSIEEGGVLMTETGRDAGKVSVFYSGGAIHVNLSHAT